MKRKIKARYCMLVIITILCIAFLLWGVKEIGIGLWFPNTDMAQNEKRETNVAELQNRVEQNYGIWASLIEDTAFSDVCSDVYAKRFEDIADEFIECYEEFDSLDEDETTIENYKQYREYFTVYRDMGRALDEFAKAIRESRYDEAITKIEELRTLNRKIPIVQ